MLLSFLTVQRLGEMAWSRRNTRRLLDRGAVEAGAAHYPYVVAFHAVWLATLWFIGWNAALHPLWTAVFLGLQVLRLWILVTLGARWTTRVIVAPEPLVRCGPYRLMRHPNYAVVFAEIAVVPLALGAPLAALFFSLVHLPLLALRIRIEDRALAEEGMAGAETRR